MLNFIQVKANKKKLPLAPRRKCPWGNYLVSIHKWSFGPISASIGGIAWAAYLRLPPRNPSIFLTLDKIRFLN